MINEKLRFSILIYLSKEMILFQYGQLLLCLRKTKHGCVSVSVPRSPKPKLRLPPKQIMKYIKQPFPHFVPDKY